ncbi:unknown; predicted coding region [Mycoplasmopsis pulmonis]|uniref:Uncharacterized protein n=1 Tax=Mycoplasmopsis pulmonis (strain UAB CTIP) TaxID=272635 RepID=Q98R46_MYCPU|nr:unknown; predicted coding region [Mycoplasmopsis pulmonis]
MGSIPTSLAKCILHQKSRQYNLDFYKKIVLLNTFIKAKKHKKIKLNWTWFFY